MVKKFIPASVANIIIFVFLGFLNARTSNNELGFYWYDTLVKSPLNPPNFVFAVAWTILYILIALSFTFLLFSKPNSEDKYAMSRFYCCFTIFILQFVVNLVWSYLFWSFRNPTLALIDIIALDILVIMLLIVLYRQSKISFYLLLPYMCWILFATYLNAYIVVAN